MVIESDLQNEIEEALIDYASKLIEGKQDV
jgi:hypothetical protein